MTGKRAGRTREESERLAEELEATGIALSGDLGIEMLVKAADIRRDELDDPRGAMVLLRRILKDAPRSHIALSRALSLAVHMGAHEDLVELLQLAARATARSGPRAQLLARRADVLAIDLGRIAEARSQYREAAKLAPGTALSSASDSAADRIDARLADEKSGGSSDLGDALPPVVTEPLRFGDAQDEVASADTDAALETLRARIGARAPLDQTLVMEAVEVGLTRGVDDAAERVLPWMRPARRAALLDEIAIGADGAHDPDAAQFARAAAFRDDPSRMENFDALVAVATKQNNDDVLARTIERRAQTIGSSGLVVRCEAIADTKRRAQVLIELVRSAHDIETLVGAIDAARALAEAIERPRVAARALAAGASHTWLPAKDRAAILVQMATLLREIFGDGEGARIVEREAKAMADRGGDTEPDQPSPFFNEATLGRGTEETTNKLADEVASLVRSQLPAEVAVPTDDPVVLMRAGYVREAVELVVAGAHPPDVAFLIARRARRWGANEAAGEALHTAWAGTSDDTLRTAIAKEAAALAETGVAVRDILTASTLQDRAARRLVSLSCVELDQDARAAIELRTIFDDDPEDTLVAAALVKHYTATDQSDAADAIVQRIDRLDTPRLVCAVARHYERRADVGRAHAVLRTALERDAAAVDVARCAYEIAARAGDDAVVDDALRALRVAWFERGDREAAFLVAAALVARSADGTADRVVYDDHRHRVRHTPRTALPMEWCADLAVNFDDAPRTNSTAHRWPTLLLSDPALEALDAVRVAFRMPRVTVCASPDGRVQVASQNGPAIAVAGELSAYPKRLRFDLARGMAALADARLAPALLFVQESDDSPPEAVQALDRAGLVLSTDPALALGEVGPRTARGAALTNYIVGGSLGAIWSAMGLGLPPRVSRDPSREPR